MVETKFRKLQTSTLEIGYEESGAESGVPVVLHGEADGVDPPPSDEQHAAYLTSRRERRIVPGAGHFLPREAPDAMVAAVRPCSRRAVLGLQVAGVTVAAEA